MKIVIINVKYSPNLGDGVIAECLESQLLKGFPGADISSLDIGGMTDYGLGGSIVGKSIGLTKYLCVFPLFLQSLIKTRIMPILVKYKYSKIWRDRLNGSDVLIIGGGHLLMDVDNYFPSRIMTAITAAPKGVDIYVHAVGVSKKWTNRGVSYFKKAFSHGNLRMVTLRDNQSLNNWKELFPGIPASVSRDPAILAIECYGVFNKNNYSRRLIGLGVSDIGNMLMHSDLDSKIVCGDFNSYVDLAQRLKSSGYDVMLFTNGDDEGYLNELVSFIKNNYPDLERWIKVAPRPLRPIDLVRQISIFDAVVAHRLHANILAYAYAIPTVGLGWDRKLESFMVASGRAAYLVRTNSEIDRVVNMVKDFFNDSEFSNISLISEAALGSEKLISSIKETLSDRIL